MKLAPAPTYPRVDLSNLCKGPHEYGPGVLFSGLLGPSVRFQCRNCTACLTGSGVDLVRFAAGGETLAIVFLTEDEVLSLGKT